MGILHRKVSGVAAPTDPDLVGGPDWDDSHAVKFDLVDDAYTAVAGDCLYLATDSTGLPGTTDSDAASVVILLPLESDYADLKNHAATPTGSVTLQPSGNPAPYGRGSLLANTNSRLEFADSTDFDFSGDFTFECWVRPTGLSGLQQLYSQRNGGSNGIGIGFSGTSPFVWIDGTTVISSGYTFSNGVAVHYAVSRNSSTVRLFVNGSQVASGTYGSSFSNTANVCIGGDNWVGQHFFGFIKDVRVTKGVGRYTGTFSLPTMSYSANGLYLPLTMPVSPSTGDAITFFTGPGPAEIRILGNGHNVNGVSTYVLTPANNELRIVIYDGAQWRVK